MNQVIISNNTWEFIVGLTCVDGGSSEHNLKQSESLLPDQKN